MELNIRDFQGGFVSDLIGEEYKNWKSGDSILLTAPTGSGKSTFILRYLLKHAASNNQRILYLVNRKALYRQIMEDLKEVIKEQHMGGKTDCSLDNYIHVMTYQYLEQRLNGDTGNQAIMYLQNFTYVVCDECHYFYADSDFNTNTELSFDCIQSEFDKKIKIFISATLDNVKEEIIQRTPITVSWDGYVTSDVMKNIFNRRSFTYTLPRNYDYVRVKCFEKIKDLKNIIEANILTTKDKWLIFTDSIDNGKQIEEEIIEAKIISSDEVVFIDAQYEKDEEAFESVNELAKKKYINKRIVISTSVMDNGISFIDQGLRNMVILAETEETFLQMLGRKRRDSRDVDLYICKRSIEHFKKRKNMLESLWEYWYEHQKTFERMLIRRKKEGSVTIYPYTHLYYMWNPQMNGEKIVDYRQLVDVWELLEMQQLILSKILHKKSIYQKASKLCYSVNGVVALNSFAVKKVIKSIQFYTSMIEALEKDENAFLKKQLEWLGYSVDIAENITEEMDKKVVERHRENIETVIMNYVDRTFDEKDNRKLKSEIEDDAIFFLRRTPDYKIADELSLTKSDRNFSKKKFDRCMQQADLPYRMMKPKGNLFTIKKITEEE